MNHNKLILLFVSLVLFYVVYKINYETYQNYQDINYIPKIIISTYHNKSKIPQKVYNNISKYAKNYKHKIFDDKEIILFLKQNYPSNVLKSFYNLKGAHKADLFRYCYLYKYGGIYIDIKTELIENIDDTFNKRNVNLYTVLSMFKGTIYQGIIASVPNNPIFKELIDYIVQIQKPVHIYFAFTIDFYNNLKKNSLNKIKKGYNQYKDGSNYYLFYEKCSTNKNDCLDGLDRYKRCCFVYDKEIRKIKIRYSDYPW